VWFISYSHDHLPPHVHGRYAGTQVVIDLLVGGKVRRAKRADSVLPKNAKRGDVRRILNIAAKHGVELKELWEKAHGKAS
jgi:hypothetical protein